MFLRADKSNAIGFIVGVDDTGDVGKFAVSVDSVEVVTGLDFFEEVGVGNSVEAMQYQKQLWSSD